MSLPTDTIKRAFELAEELPTVAHIRAALKDEGYPSVEEHLGGKVIREQLNEIIAARRNA